MTLFNTVKNAIQKNLRVIIFVIVILLASKVKGVENFEDGGKKHTYAVHEKRDHSGDDIKNYPDKTMAELQQLCSADSECVAFNTDGWLKRESSLDEGETPQTLYVKGAEIKEEEVIVAESEEVIVAESDEEPVEKKESSSWCFIL